MRENYTLPRLYVDADLTAGAGLLLDRAQSHYLSSVMRKSVGDSLRVFNGRDGEWLAEITDVNRKAAQLKIGLQSRPQTTPPDIWLCFAPVRKARNAFIAEKAAELGAARLQPVLTERVQFPKMGLEKLELTLIEAAEQTERLDIPALVDTVSLGKLLDEWDPKRALIFADEASSNTEWEAKPALEALPNCPAPAAILIGPEGGFTDAERARLRDCDFVTPVSLGPRILRADTAALSLLTLWQAVQGDLG
ncbi:16S rRNA (uracil(1498)-N(3))-methyltransferase [Robiginitomaculum antarcticum]|uniref:16S rRNA (uracil(1498)-N(3))-methyltransferase n=1 Tax=Robiginitomaculum antarcticum TaxID=437507 RepID=UPI00037F6848|nr:16S rRNA (uracil(1498)-N(3))-methyltransferase [Robiginitomaculum antarcticum]